MHFFFETALFKPIGDTHRQRSHECTASLTGHPGPKYLADCVEKEDYDAVKKCQKRLAKQQTTRYDVPSEIPTAIFQEYKLKFIVVRRNLDKHFMVG